MNEAAIDINLDGLDFSPELISEIEAIEPSETASAEPEPNQDNDKGEMTAEFMVEMIEAGFKSFINEDYELPTKKKAVIVSNFTPVLDKYDGGIIALLGQYKEEGQAIFALAMLGFSMWASIKEMKKQPVKEDSDGEK